MRYLVDLLVPRPPRFLGTLIGGGLSLLGVRQTNKANAKLAHEQMEFQERMSSTAHQREVEDLRAAGLNPILSGTGGHGSSAPPGAMATMQSELGAGVHGALEARRTEAQTELQEAEAKGAEARAKRDSQIADLFEKVMPRIIQGITTVEGGARRAGELAGQVEARIREALSGSGHPLGKPGEAASAAVTDLIEDLVNRFKPNPKRPMPAAKVPDPFEVFQSSAKGHHSSPTLESRRLQETMEGTSFKSGRERGINWRKRPTR